ncbi:MAG TPA: 6-phosphogluconolactonase [bacterium]|nr:6-phosphogluconolactonase [bacterium]HPN42988.1 6-phosphogluconolactonase [bacterium]
MIKKNTINKIQSMVEQVFLERSGRKFWYTPTEKIKIVEVENFPALGKLTALRFLEWVQENPNGVISLPTGKTPEHFIKWVTWYLDKWHLPQVQQDLQENGINPEKKPVMSGLHFIQIDEFYPINPQQHNSFHYYVKKFYIQGFGLNPQKAMLINCQDVGVPVGMSLKDVFPNDIVDLGLRTRHAQNSVEQIQKNVIEAVDQYCSDYERKIREIGGIGFFLGGIGPDGHIAFNIRGSDHYSTTRLTATNYETQAAAATDLGGIEVSKNRLVITVGLSTITFNKNAVSIIIAAGEAKARIIAQSVENEENNLYPATCLQRQPNARFYLTHGAASRLVERQYEDLCKSVTLSQVQIEKVIIDLSLEKGKRIRDLSFKELQANRFSRAVLKMCGDNYKTVLSQVEASLINKLQRGLETIENKTFMHTAPHHDDIMLGYLPYIYHLVRTPLNKHFFNYMTSGFNAVTNHYVLNMLRNLLKFIDTPNFARLMTEGYFNPANENYRNRDVSRYLDGIANYSESLKDEANARRILRDLVFLFEEDSLTHLKDRINELIDYFSTQYPGKKDLAYIQQLKGMIREWEADVLWAHFGFDSRSVNHLRLGFYKGEIFTEEPEIDRDVRPLTQLIHKIKPDVVSVAFDPEGSGPDTHYKVMQAVAEALKIYENETNISNIEVWGYRNVWYRFHPAEVNVFVPVSLNSMEVLKSTFRNSFGSQRDASFPSYEYDGPFSRLAQRIQAEQFQIMKTCLGEEFFTGNSHPRLRASHGLCFLVKMDLAEFYEHTIELRNKIESSNSDEPDL